MGILITFHALKNRKCFVVEVLAWKRDPSGSTSDYSSGGTEGVTDGKKDKRSHPVALHGGHHFLSDGNLPVDLIDGAGASEERLRGAETVTAGNRSTCREVPRLQTEDGP